MMNQRGFGVFHPKSMSWERSIRIKVNSDYDEKPSVTWPFAEVRPLHVVWTGEEVLILEAVNVWN